MPTLDWIGKDKVVNHHLDVPFRVLNREYSYDDVHGQQTKDNGSENMIIHGDNLEALKALLPKYECRIKCIYIDPPYNTGEEGWIYNDNVDDPIIRKWLGEVVGIEGEDLSRHDKWLCMIYPRIRLLHKLLKDDGVIFISIDDNEYASLKLVMDEIFGASNSISTFIWEKRVNRENRKVVSSRHDYILCYCKNKQLNPKPIKKLPMTAEALKRYQNPDNDPRGPWKSDPCTAQAGHATQSQFYEIRLPNGVVHTPPAGRCWLYTEPVMMKAINEGRIWLGKNGKNTPRKKTYLYEKERGLIPESILFAKDVSTNEMAKNELKRIFSKEIPFTTIKPHQLIEQLIRIVCESGDIILDSFAGSGTTGHAVLNINKTDGGNKTFILVELMDYAETITAERIKRVITGYSAKNKKVEGLGGSFSFYELGPSLMVGDYLNEEIGIERIREYIYYTETKTSLLESNPNEPSYMGTHAHTAYYFNYTPDAATTLNHDFLETIRTKADSYVIYADRCTLSKAELERFRIIFKKIPRDITRF